jgi:hypothetical protein
VGEGVINNCDFSDLNGKNGSTKEKPERFNLSGFFEFC